MRGAVDEWADGLLPIEAVGDVVAFKVVAAGEAQECRMHRGQLFHQVDAVAVHAIVIGGREEGDEVEPEGSGVADGEDQVIVRRGLQSRRFSALNSYCFQSVPTAGTVAVVIALPVSSLTRLTGDGPRSVEPALA